MADAIFGHGDKKEFLQRLYLTISDDDLMRAIGHDEARCG